MKDRILLSFNLSIIILALFSVLISLLRVFNLLFLSIIVYSPSGVTLAPHILIIGVTSTTSLSVKAIGANTKNNLGLNLSAYFTLIISFYFAGHA
jgi:hypothetical protein